MAGVKRNTVLLRYKKQSCIGSYLEEEAEADPLVVLVVSPLLWVQRFVNAWVCHIEADALPEGTGDGICGMDPTVGVEHLLRNVPGVNAVNGIAHVLLRRHDQREGKHARGRHRVVESEDPRVYVNVRDAEKPAELAEALQHVGGC